MRGLYKPEFPREGWLCVANTAAGKTNSLHILESFYKGTARQSLPVCRAISCHGKSHIILQYLAAYFVHKVLLDYFAVMVQKSRWCHEKGAIKLH